jgi:alkylated DNA repair dioxygenase AlkB
MSHYTYYPGLYKHVEYKDILAEAAVHLMHADQMKRSGPSAGRVSFVVGPSKYYHLHMVCFDLVPLIDSIRKYILETFGIVSDYCLVHLYFDGDAAIAWHSDKEALNSPVVSVSFGATREFRFRLIGQTSGYTDTVQLRSGDLLIMNIGCQQMYEHCITKSKRVTDARINLTFRCR